MRPIWENYFYPSNDVIKMVEKNENYYAIKLEYVYLVMELIREGKEFVADKGINDDHLRNKNEKGEIKIDQIAIHYTKTEQKIKDLFTNDQLLLYIEALHYIRLYCNYYSNSNFAESNRLLYSGHYDKNEKQRYLAYRYVIFDNGEVKEGIDNDKYLTWHSKGINNSSIGLAFVTDTDPTESALDSCAKIIVQYMQKYDITLENIIGHKEVHKINPKIDINHTLCPGKNFLDDADRGIVGWKNKLIQKVQNLLILTQK
jgi:N-acetylmuramoyl-L-alanine amidase